MLRYKKLLILGAILFIGTLQSMQRSRLNNKAAYSMLKQKEESVIKDLYWQSIASCFAGLSCFFAHVYPSYADPIVGQTVGTCCCCCLTACLVGNACINCLAACQRQKKLTETLKKMHDLERAE